jgi:hypothetical protein
LRDAPGHRHEGGHPDEHLVEDAGQTVDVGPGIQLALSRHEAASKRIYLVLRNITRRWHKAPREWKAAMNQFAILYPDRFLVSG